ncbi:MAG: MarR family transcriptional regulator, partial [Rhodospirillaceae bacterium]|nr:MarR family transcriptional regulator [Rhodospirillaceae bacterium]
RLSATQRARIAKAYRSAGGVAVEGYREVLMGIIDEADRRRFDRP